MTFRTAYLLLLAAVSLEVAGTMTIKFTSNFTRLWPSLAVLLSYGASFYLLSHVLKMVPVGISYAIWSGLGILATTVLAWIYFKQKLDLPALIGLALILAGVLVITLFSKSAA